MNFKLRLALVLLVAWAGAASVRAELSEAAAERLMRSSGLWEQLGSTAAGARAGIEAAVSSQRAQIGSAELSRMLAATDAAFAPQALRDSVRRGLAARLHGAHAEALQTWFDGAAGRHITALEVAATAPERDSGALIRSGSARLRQISAVRGTLLGQIVEATRTAEAITNVTIHVALAVQRGLASTRPGAPAAGADTLSQELALQRPQMLQGYGAMALALYAEIYGELTDAQLGDFLAFLRSAAAAQFIEAGIAAVQHALVEAGERLGSRVSSTRSGANA